MQGDLGFDDADHLFQLRLGEGVDGHLAVEQHVGPGHGVELFEPFIQHLPLFVPFVVNRTLGRFFAGEVLIHATHDGHEFVHGEYDFIQGTPPKVFWRRRYFRFGARDAFT